MDKKKALNKIIGDIKKRTPDISLGLGELDAVEFISTPFNTVNTMTGGGLPKGKFTTIAGAERTAKGTLLLQTIGYQMQIDPEFYVLWTDAEDALDEAWCLAHGIDLDRIVVQKYSDDAPYFEKLLDDGLKVIETGAINMWVIDSVAALLPKAEEKKDIEENAMLDLQRKLPVFFRKAVRIMNKTKTACVLIGQIYDVPNATYVQKEVKGGNALKHYAHLRLLTRRGNKDEARHGQGDVTMADGTTRKVHLGWAQHIKVDKTRINENEGHEVVLQFVYGRGLDAVDAAITSLFANSIIDSRGAWCYHDEFPDGKLNGKKAAIKWLQDNPKVRTKMIEEMDAILLAGASEPDETAVAAE